MCEIRFNIGDHILANPERDRFARKDGEPIVSAPDAHDWGRAESRQKWVDEIRIPINGQGLAGGTVFQFLSPKAEGKNPGAFLNCMYEGNPVIQHSVRFRFINAIGTIIIAETDGTVITWYRDDTKEIVPPLVKHEDVIRWGLPLSATLTFRDPLTQDVAIMTLRNDPEKWHGTSFILKMPGEPIETGDRMVELENLNPGGQEVIVPTPDGTGTTSGIYRRKRWIFDYKNLPSALLNDIQTKGECTAALSQVRALISQKNRPTIKF